MGIVFTNNASTTTVVELTPYSTSVVLRAGTGSLFPDLGPEDYFFVTLEDTAGRMEVVRVNGRVVDTLSVVRAQEGTAARSFPVNTRVELRLTTQMLLDALNDLNALIL